MTHRSKGNELPSTLERKRELPLSMENVRKKIIRVVQKVETEAREFLRKYAGSLDTHSNWTKSVEKACAQVGRSPADLHDLDDLDAVLLRVRVNQEMPLSDYNELRRMIERARVFDYIAYELPGDLVDVYVNQVEKFCLSFCQETQRQDLQSVTDYERVISECRQQIAGSLSQVEEDLDEVEDHRRVSVAKYIENYETVLDRMRSICRGIGDVCSELRRWVAADAEYVRNVQEEINADNRRLVDLRNAASEMEQGRDSEGKKARHATVSLEKVEKRLVAMREEIGHYKARKRNVEENRLSLEAELTKKQDEHEAVQERLRDRQNNSESLNVKLSTHYEALRTEIRSMESRLRQMDVQVESLQSEEQRSRLEMEKVSAEAESIRKRHGGLFERREKHEETLKTIREDMVNTEEKIAALKKIRDVKLRPASLKRIHNHGYNPDHVFEIKGKQ